MFVVFIMGNITWNHYIDFILECISISEYIYIYIVYLYPMHKNIQGMAECILEQILDHDQVQYTIKLYKYESTLGQITVLT